MALPPTYNFFKNSRVEMADGMNNVGYEHYTWGDKFEWENLPILGTNLIVVKSELDDKQKREVQNWYSSSEVRKIATPEKGFISDLDGVKFGPDLVILEREAQKDRAPFLPDYTVRKFSFDNRDLKIDSRKMTAGLSSMIGKSDEEKIEVERYIGGVLHMLNGTIWVLEDNQENIICSVLYGSKEPELYWNIEIMGIIPQFKQTKLLEDLLSFTFESYQSSPVYCYTLDKSEEYQWLINLGFNKSGRLHITV